MKRIFSFFIVSVSSAWLCACASLSGPNLAGELSREEAVRLYNGEIAESAWLEKLDTISRSLPIANTCSVQLADGFLFYETQLRDGERIVVNVIPPADAPESLKQLAASFRPKAPESRDLIVRCGNGKFYLNDTPMSESELCDALRKAGSVPADKRPELRFSGNNIGAADIAKFLSAFDAASVPAKND